MRATISVPEAARRTGCFSTYIYQLITNGKIQARKTDGRWLVDLTAFEAWLKAHQSNQAKRSRPVEEQTEPELAMPA